MSSEKKNINKLSFGESSKNIFLNSSILILGAIVLLLAFLLYKNISGYFINETRPEYKTTDEYIQAEVLNGCGVSGLGEKFTDFLRKNKVDVVQTGNYITFEIEKTLVIDRGGNISNANKIAALLGVEKNTVLQQLNEDYFLDVSVVIGKDYQKLKPFK